jgi:glycosyltransferase involved in cell wall biosynthesis
LQVARDTFDSDHEFVQAVSDLAMGHIPIIAGPLELCILLRGIDAPTILLSWGFDLQEANPIPGLSSLSAVLVDSTANEALARAAGAKEVLLIPWGIDTALFVDEGMVMDLSPYGVAGDEAVVLSLRAHESRYRVDDIIRAFARKPRSARLVIGNAGSMTHTLQALGENLGVDAVFLPPFAEDDLPPLLRRSSVYVTASNVDGTSVTLLQAMACGVPVVASTNAGNVDWVHNEETGFTFPIGDIDALSAAMDAAMGQGSRVRAQARRSVLERADWHRNIRQLTALLTQSA